MNSLPDLNNIFGMFYLGREGRDLGHGLDAYHEAMPLTYAMAYSCHIRACLKLVSALNDEGYLRIAQSCLRELYEIATVAENSMSWGLPFPWRDNPANHPYTITTALAGIAIIEMHIAHHTPRELEALEKIVNFLIVENPWEKEPPTLDSKSWCPHFSPTDKVLAVNVASIVGGFLVSYASTIGKGDALAMNYGRKALEFVRLMQEGSGFWTYSPESDVIDNIHTAYTIDGLLMAYAANKPDEFSRSLRDPIRRGIKFYRTFIGKDGRMPEKRLLAAGSSRSRKYPGESRSHGYGGALSTFCLARRLGAVRTTSDINKITMYVLEHLVSDEGRVYYKSEEHQLYARNEAFVMQGLADVVSLKRKLGQKD